MCPSWAKQWRHLFDFIFAANVRLAALRRWVGVWGLAVKPHCQQGIVSGIIFYE